MYFSIFKYFMSIHDWLLAFLEANEDFRRTDYDKLHHRLIIQ